MKKGIIKNINLNKLELNKYFGKTELKIITFLIKHQTMSVDEFKNSKLNSSNLHANTITTIANRMVKKKYLKKLKT